MKKFEVGRTYSTRSACNHDCVFSYTVTGRTACTVTVMDRFGESRKCRIVKSLSAYRGAETIRPLGDYSMAPVISA